MYDFLEGRVTHFTPTRLVLNVGGIGFAIDVPVSTYEALAKTGDVHVWTHFHVREDSQRMFGFATVDERRLFEMLIGVSGVGPAVAINLLSRASVDDIVQAIVEQRLDVLTSLKGVGKKTAQRLVTELADKVAVFGAGVDALSSSTPTDARESDAAQALQVLGYPPKSAQKAVRKVLDQRPNASVEDVVRDALRLV